MAVIDSRGERVGSPTLLNTLLEARWVWEYFSWFAFSEKRVTQSCGRGDGRPILVLPGFLASDSTTWPLRRFLTRLGYEAFGWGLGTNWGFRPGMHVRLLKRVSDLYESYGRPITLIGWSLGGVHARHLAAVRPDQIGAVITLGTPQQGSPRVAAAVVWQAFLWLNRQRLGYLSNATFEEYLRPTFIPSLSIYSRGDGIVPWQHCRRPRGQGGLECEVRGSHCGLVHNPEALRSIAEYLKAHPVPARGALPAENAVTDYKTLYINGCGV